MNWRSEFCVAPADGFGNLLDNLLAPEAAAPRIRSRTPPNRAGALRAPLHHASHGLHPVVLALDGGGSGAVRRLFLPCA